MMELLPKMQRAICVFALLFVQVSFAGRDITLPFFESFDTDAYAEDLVWVSKQQGAGHTWLPQGGWRGGAAKFVPPTGEGYSGLGQFSGLRAGNYTQLNVRFLIYHGAAYAASSPVQNKLFIFIRTEGARPMVITRNYNNWQTYGACDGTVCWYEGGDYWPTGAETFRIGPPPYRQEEWIGVELEANTLEGYVRLYLYSRDGKFNGVYVQNDMIDSGPGGIWTFVDILGGYFHAGCRADPDNYFKIDELAIDNRHIGPPAGFGPTRVANRTESQTLALEPQINAGSIRFHVRTQNPEPFTLEVYNLLGQRLWRSSQPAGGDRVVVWQPPPLASGMVFVVLRQGGNTIKRRFWLP